MRAIEATGQIDNKGNLRLDNPLLMREKKVKVIILVADTEDETDEQLWLKAAASNPAFDFLHDEAEDIYKPTDGQPLQNER